MTTKAQNSLDDADLSRVKGATSVLVLAPEMEETVNRVCYDLLTPEQPDKSGIIKISYHFSPTEIADRWLRENPDSAARLYCLSVSDSSSRGSDAYGDNISFENARADDLTGIGMKINQIVGEVDGVNSDILVCLDSLDSMLMYADERTVYRFIRTISNFLATNDARIHFHIDPTQNEEVVNTLRSAVNAVLEVGEAGIINIKTR